MSSLTTSGHVPITLGLLQGTSIPAGGNRKITCVETVSVRFAQPLSNSIRNVAFNICHLRFKLCDVVI